MCVCPSFFKKIESCEIDDFPKLEEADLKEITLGSYQMKQSLSYIAQHMHETGLYDLEAFKDDDMVRARVMSRHLNKVKYFVYIKYKPNENSIEGITDWFCRCKNGSRTLGSCAHIASVIYFLSNIRYKDEPIHEPAAKLNKLFSHAEQIVHESSGEEDI